METGQFRTMLWLRWRLTLNQLARGGKFNATLSVIVLVGIAVLGLVGGVAALMLGLFRWAAATPTTLMWIWDALLAFFLFFWCMGLLASIQRSETIDVRKLLHLPVSLRGLFLINYLASHLTPSIALFLPVMFGLSIGLMLGRGGSMGAMLPLVIGFFFMITAWTYCLRGWLVALMVNPRRRRSVIAIVTFLVVLLSQLPYIVGHLVPHPQRVGHGREHTTERGIPAARDSATAPPRGSEGWISNAHRYVPLLWPALGVRGLAEGRVTPALWGILGTFLLGGLGFARAYRGTIRFYSGVATAKVRRIKPERPVRTPERRVTWMERRLPGLPEEASALALASFRCLLRAPEVKMSLMTNTLFLVFLGAMSLSRRSEGLGPASQPLAVTCVVLAPCYVLVQLAFNQFGYDGNGFRTISMVPTSRAAILLGKNVALLPILICIGAVCLVAVGLRTGMSPATLLIGCLQLISGALLVGMLGNFLSITLPYRVAAGSMAATKTKSTVGILVGLSHLLLPVALAPLFLVPLAGWLLGRLTGLPTAATHGLLALVLLLIVAVAYRYSLGPLGRLLERREKRILEVVTRAVE